MSSKVRRIDFSPDEWIAGTAGLDNAERGLYWDACAMIYSHGGAIKIDDLKARSRDHGNAFNRQLRRLVTLGKLLRNGQEITNKRCENELEKAGKRAEKGRELAGQRWNNNTLDTPPALRPRNGNHQPSTINHQLIPPKPPKGGENAQAEFENWWAAYPRKVGKDAAARKYLAVRKTVSAAELLVAAERYASAAPPEKQFIAHPATWLNHGRWKDDLTEASVPAVDRPTEPPPNPEDIWPELAAQ